MAWAIEEKNYSQRRACQLVGMAPRVYRYRSAVQTMPAFATDCASWRQNVDASAIAGCILC